jgi:hypothetical protein
MVCKYLCSIFVKEMRRLISFAFLIFFSFATCAQDSAKVAAPVQLGDDNDAIILYRHEASGGLTVHSNGWGVTFKSGKHVTGFRKRILDFEIISMSHPKEYRVTNAYDGAKSFIYGKLNSVFIVRGGWGYQNIIFGKAERSGVEVRYNYYGGVDLGLTKPVYLDILVSDPTNPGEPYVPIVTERYDPKDPNQTISNIYGGSSFFRGFGEMSLYPGVYGKFALSFEYAGWQQKIAALEVGAMADYFPKAIPIMAYNPNDNLYFNFYISILWGGKW